MNRSKAYTANSREKKPTMKQKSISSFFFQTKKPSKSFSDGLQKSTVSKENIPPSVSSVKGSLRSESNFSDSGSFSGSFPTQDRPRPKLSRAPSSLFNSQGSFDEYDPDQEIQKLMNTAQLNNFKRPTITHLTRVPSFQRAASSFSSNSSTSSPKKVEHHMTQLDDRTFREMTSISASSRQLSFTSSTQIDTLSQSEMSSQYTSVSKSVALKRSNSSLQSLGLGGTKRLKPLSSNPREATSNNANIKGKNGKPLVKLTKEQEYVVDLVVKKHQNVFYTGSAGTGKSVILANIVTNLQRIYGSETVAITASTGLAAASIGGITLHKWSHIGIGNRSLQSLVNMIQKRRDATMSWRNTKVLIIDEISMIDGRFLTKLEYIARAIRKNEKPFGGIQLVFTGDFFQLPPVAKKDGPQLVNGEGGSIFCFESEVWKRCIQKTILLTKVFRQQDNELIDILNCIRFGEIESHMVRTIRQLEREVRYDDGILPTEIYATRREVELSNSRQLENLPGESYKFDASDMAPKELLHVLDSAVMAEKSLTLKENAQVMMLKNKPDVELFNGSLGKVLFFTTERLARKFIELYKILDEDAIIDMRLVSKAISNRRIRQSKEFEQDLHARPLSRYAKLEEMINHAMNESPHERVYPYVRWSIGKGKYFHELVEPDVFPVDLPGEQGGLQRTQLPIMLCWALSIHKAQGQTIPRLKVDLRNIFEAGQVYVALSRAVSKECLQVKNFNPKKIRTNEKVKQFYKNLETVRH